MGQAKSQFVVGGNTKDSGTSTGAYSKDNFLLDSLLTIAEDTRGGLSGPAAARVAAMTGYVEGNPDKTDAAQFKGYIAKLTTASNTAAKPASGLRSSKPGSGIM